MRLSDSHNFFYPPVLAVYTMPYLPGGDSIRADKMSEGFIFRLDDLNNAKWMHYHPERALKFICGNEDIVLEYPRAKGLSERTFDALNKVEAIYGAPKRF